MIRIDNKINYIYIYIYIYIVRCINCHTLHNTNIIIIIMISIIICCNTVDLVPSPLCVYVYVCVCVYMCVCRHVLRYITHTHTSME